MNQRHGPAADMAMRWSACSDHFLEAAEHLPPRSRAMSMPRMQLLATAVRYRLKAFICAVRGGAPGTDDLSRLATLAVHCGLTLTPEQLEGVASLYQAQLESSGSAGPTTVDRVRQLCASISAQTPT